MIRVLILAAGDGTRWGDFRDTSKHLTKIEGEVLLHRTCRQFLNYTNDVVVVGPDETYSFEGTRLYIPPINKARWMDMAKFWSSHEQWSSGRTVLVFGDVYFTNDAVKTIMTNTDPWKFFLRKGESSVTGCPYKEIFGIAFDASEQGRFRMKITDLMNKKVATSGGGWHLFSTLVFETHMYLFDNPYYVNIDDWTEDFDFPSDLEAWEMRRGWAKIGAAENSSSSERPAKDASKAESSDPSEQQSPRPEKASRRRSATS